MSFAFVCHKLELKREKGFEMTKTALILGATGKFGSHAASALAADGWSIRRYSRKDDDILHAALGADIIVNGLNPPGYKNWDTEIPRITTMVIAAAKASGATLVVPGNVYPIGATAGVWNENTSHQPNTRKGRIRTEMETAYRTAAKDGIRTIILRAGDFIDPGATGNWINQLLAKISKGRFIYPGNPNIAHAWAYLPDLGRAVAELADKRHELAAFEDIPFPGFTLSGNQMRQAVENATGQLLQQRKFPWWLIRLISPFWPLGGELLEMRYLWDTPHSLSPAKFNRLLPAFRNTEPQAAFASVLTADIYPNQPMSPAKLLA